MRIPSPIASAPEAEHTKVDAVNVGEVVAGAVKPAVLPAIVGSAV